MNANATATSDRQHDVGGKKIEPETAQAEAGNADNTAAAQPEALAPGQSASEQEAAESVLAQSASEQSVSEQPTSGQPVSQQPASGSAIVPEPRAAAESDGEAERGGKSKKPRRAVRTKSAGGTKALVVWREGRLHYADDSVLVIDLDEAASPDVDMHDVVDRLAELRDAIESAGRTETAAALGEIIQEKALN